MQVDGSSSRADTERDAAIVIRYARRIRSSCAWSLEFIQVALVIVLGRQRLAASGREDAFDAVAHEFLQLGAISG